MSLTIRRLCEVPEFADLCWQWELENWSSPPGTEAFFDNHYPQAAANTGKELPQVWLAFRDNQPVAMVSLVKDDHPDFTHLTPWFASGYVVPEARTTKVAHLTRQVLLDFVRNELGLPAIYCYTHMKMERKGWTLMQNIPDPFEPAKTVGLYSLSTAQP